MPAKKEPKPKVHQTTQNVLPEEDQLEKKRVTSHEKAGVVFPVARILGLMKDSGVAQRISPNAAVQAATLLEYLTAELLEVSGEVCTQESKGKRKMLKPRHISIALKNDPDLKEVCGKDIIIPTAGVMPSIHPELEEKKKKKKSKYLETQAKDSEASGDSEEDSDEDMAAEDSS